MNYWVNFDEMTDDEKSQNPKAETCGGYLKQMGYKDAFQRSYTKAEQSDKDLVWDLPNFDPDVFFEISGIRVEPQKKPYFFLFQRGVNKYD